MSVVLVSLIFYCLFETLLPSLLYVYSFYFLITVLSLHYIAFVLDKIGSLLCFLAFMVFFFLLILCLYCACGFIYVHLAHTDFVNVKL